MDIIYPAFEKARMIRKGDQLVAPIVSLSSDMSLPKNSLLHYLGESKIDVGPRSDNPIIKQVNKPVQVYTPLRLIEPVNSPKQVAFDANPLIRGYLIRNRRMRKISELDRIPNDEKSLVVINYALVHNSYKYTRSLFAEHNEWVDLMYTVTSTMNTIAQTSQRNQFIMLGVPDILPSISRLKMASTTVDQATLKLFHTDQSRMLLELWKWLDEEKFPNIFDRIEEKHYRFINFIIQDSNHWVAINMGKLHSWKASIRTEMQEKIIAQRKAKEKVSTDPVDKPSTMSYPEAQLQKYILRLFMLLTSVRTVTGIDGDAQMQNAMVPKEMRGEKPGTPPVSQEDLENDDEEGGPNEAALGQDEEEIAVKKESDLEGSPISSTSSKNSVVKSSEEILKAAARLNANEDDDSSKIEINDEVNALIDADLVELETISAHEEKRNAVVVKEGEPLPLAVVDNRSYEAKTRDRCNLLAEAGLLTGAEYRRLTTLAEKYKTIPNPHGSGTLIDAMVVTPEEIHVDNKHVVAPNATVIDPTSAYSSIEKTQQKYIKHTLNKHILKMITHVQSANIILDTLEVERTEDILGASINYSVRNVPVEGAPSTWRFPIPEINEDGTYTASGTKYSMRNLRGDYPIRKVAPNRVAITSYFGKYNIYRSRKAANDYAQWLINEVMSLGFDPSIENITDVMTANVFHMGIVAPRSVSALATQIRQFTVKASDGELFVFHMDLSKIDENFDMAIVKPWMEKGFMPIAISNKKHLVYYEGDAFYMIEGTNVKPLGELEEILGISTAEAPAEYVELKIGGKYVPVGMILAFDYGLTELVRRLKINVRRVPVGTRVSQQADEVALVFSDETLLYSKSDRMASLLLSGFLAFKRVIRGFSITDFDNKGVYQNVWDSTGGGTRVIRELTLARDLFVDPITLEVLTALKQPTDFMGILVYSTELLMDDMHRPELDMSEMRIKGYERVAGAVYQEMVRSIRAHNARPGKSRHPIEMKPFAIWTALAQDSSIVVVKDINPMSNMKQREEVTFTGTGGRNKDTMTAATREFGKNDIGIISEATKDSGEVGISTFTPPNPLLSNSLGMPVHPDKKELNMSSIFSSSVLSSAGALRDDMKRMGFISIQHDHGIAVSGQMENLLRTDYASVIPHRTTELFSVTAKQKGIVKSISDDGIAVQYADGTVKSYPLGRHYGDNAGMTIPHDLVTPLKAGAKFVEGDSITYNKGFFKPDTLNPKQVVWCNGTYANFALCEPTDVLEDASVIAQELADMLMTIQTKPRKLVVRFNQAISRLVKVGDKVTYSDALCIIQDEITSGLDIYSEADIDSLKALGAMAPKAKYDGVVERIEIKYRGDMEDMPDALRKHVKQSNNGIAARRLAAGKKVVTGAVGEGYKLNGNPIPLDSVSIEIYITGPEAAGVGDKIVLVNQLKSIIGKVLKEPMQTKDGKKVLGRFSYTSIARRIVNSPEITGSTTAILMRGAELAVEAYDS